MTLASSEIKRRQLPRSIKPALTERKWWQKTENESEPDEGVDGWEVIMIKVRHSRRGSEWL